MQVDTRVTNSTYYEQNVTRYKTNGAVFSFETGYSETDAITRSLESKRTNFFEAYEAMKSRNAASRTSREKTEETKKSEPDENCKRAPYDFLAKDGLITYKGVTFVCDVDRNRITLGDVSNPNNCLKVSLKDGGSLMVNFDNLEELTKAITMFSPEDQARIMKAITLHKMSNRAEEELEEMKIGEDDNSSDEVKDKKTKEKETAEINKGIEDKKAEDKESKFSL